MPPNKSIKTPSRTSARTDVVCVLRKPALRALNPRSGQTALEYILIFALLLLAAGAAYHFMRAPADIATFTTDVICSERL